MHGEILLFAKHLAYVADRKQWLDPTRTISNQANRACWRDCCKGRIPHLRTFVWEDAHRIVREGAFHLCQSRRLDVRFARYESHELLTDTNCFHRVIGYPE